MSRLSTLIERCAITQAHEPVGVVQNVVGMVVDSVSDVTTLTPEQIKPAPDMGTAFSSEYMIGLGTIDERMLILVDIYRLMASPEMGLSETLTAGAA